MQLLAAAYDDDLQSIDSSSINGHQHAGNAPRGGKKATETTGVARSGAVCMGGSRGGLTTKIRALVDADRLPIEL